MKLRRLVAPAVALVVAAGAVVAANTTQPSPSKAPAQERADLEREAAAETERDQSGVFYVNCGLDHTAGDDPLVHFDMPGVAHSANAAQFPAGTHDFFCARGVGPTTMPEDLLGRQTTARLLNGTPLPGDTSAWWAAAANVNGQKVTPKFLKLRYSTGGKGKGTQVPPFGLRMIAGTADPANPSDQVDWGCLPGSPYEQNPDHRPCDPRTDTRVRVRFPDCWNGRDLDTPNHRDHMAYSGIVEGGGKNFRCPASHPVPILQIIAWVHYGKNFPPGEVTLASGPSSSQHMDFMNGWDMATLEKLKRNCIDLKLKRCTEL